MSRLLPEGFLTSGDGRDRLAAASMLLGTTLLLGAFALSRASDIHAALNRSAARDRVAEVVDLSGDLLESDPGLENAPAENASAENAGSGNAGAESAETVPAVAEGAAGGDAGPAGSAGSEGVARRGATGWSPAGDASTRGSRSEEAQAEGSRFDGAAAGRVEVPLRASQPRRAAAAARPSARSSNAELVAGFRNDDVRFNAERSAHHLRQRGALAVPDLARALHSDDPQQLGYALGTLWALDPAPFPDLIERTFTAVGRRVEWSFPFGVSPSRMGLRYLARHATQVAPWARRYLGDDDPMRAFFAAYVVGRAGDLRGMSRAAPLLIAHLGDNRISGDALMACHGLAGFGRSVVPLLEDAMPEADSQAAELLRELRDTVLGQASSGGRFGRGITRVYRNPILEYDPDRSSVPHF